MNIYDELKNSKDFVYNIQNKKFIIGCGVFLDCPNDIKNLYDAFMEKVEKLVIEIEKTVSQKQVLNDCIKSFNILIKAILKITFNNMRDDYKKKLISFDESLNIEEKKEIKRQKELYIFFSDLSFKEKVKHDIPLHDLDRLKDLK